MRVGHFHRAFFLCCHQLDRRRLDNGHQRHIAVCRHRDRADIFRAEHLRNQQRGRAVRCADDADGGRIPQIKAHGRRSDHRQEQKQLGIGKQRTEVDHRADADEQQKRKGLACLNAGFKQPLDDAVRLSDALRHLVEHPGKRQIDQNRAEAHRQQQRRFILLGDRQPDQPPADRIHHRLLPRYRQQTFIQKLHFTAP